MNIFTKITLSTMKKNPVRTLVTIIGIVISTAMFTAVTTFAISLYGFIYRTGVYNEGSYHLIKYDVSREEIASWQQDERIEEVALGTGIGYAMAGSSNTYKPYVYIESGNEEFFKLLPVHLTAGRLPENDSELLVPEHLYNNGGVSYHLGDTVTFSLGNRYWLDGDGEADKDTVLLQKNGYVTEEDGTPAEILITEFEKTYTVVGFSERPEFESYSAPGYTLLTYAPDWADSEWEDGFTWDIYASVKQKYIKSVWDIYEEYKCNSANSGVLNLMGAVRYSNIAGLLMWISAIFVVIIVVGSVSMIYSAFSISVSERTKQFGLLSSIGATKRQIRRSVFTEAAAVSLVGIPAGILCGVAGIGITLHFVGSKFAYILSSPYSVELVINGYALLIAAVIALITVMISAVIPSRRAVRVSAIDAIRQHSDVKVPKGRLRSGRKYRLTYRLFGVPGMLARKYFSRSRRKYRVTIFSLTMSVILFVVTSAYCAYLKEFFGRSVTVMNYDLCYYGYSGTEPEELALPLRKAQGVSALSYSCDSTHEIVYGEEDLSDSYKNYLQKKNGAESSVTALTEGRLRTVVLFLDDVSYEEYLTVLGITDTVYQDYENAPGILCNSTRDVLYFYNEKGNYERYEISYNVFNESMSELVTAYGGYTEWVNEQALAGEEGVNGTAEEELTVEDWISAVYPVGILAETPPQLFQSGYNTTVLTFPFSSRYNPAAAGEGNDSIEFYFVQNAGQHEQLLSSVKEILEENGYPYGDSYFWDVYAYQMENENILIIINVFSYGFIILMALICVANVFNTISTNIGLRRRDFSMLRSVGLSQRGIHGMMVYECLLYGIRSLLFGMPVSAAFSYLLYQVYGGAGEFEFYIPWLAVLIAVVGVFAMVGISMVYAVSKIRGDNLIDELKEENA